MQRLRPLGHPDLPRLLPLPLPLPLLLLPGTAAGGPGSWEHPCPAPTKGCGQATAAPTHTSDHTEHQYPAQGQHASGMSRKGQGNASPEQPKEPPANYGSAHADILSRGSRHMSALPMTSSTPSRASQYGKPSTWHAVLPRGWFLGQQACFLLPCSEMGRLRKEDSATPTPGGMLCRSTRSQCVGKGLESQGRRTGDAPSAEQ